MAAPAVRVGTVARVEGLPVTDDVKTMKLRYAGTCAGCSTTIAAGQRAHYLRTSKTVRCLDCGTGGAAPAGAGASADAEASRATAHRDTLDAARDRAATRAAAFAAGAEGERLAAAALAPLSTAGYLLLHDRAIGGAANLDHIVVGPSGVWLCNAKHWSGTLTVTGGTLRQNGQRRDRALERARTERDTVGAALDTAGLHVPVHAALAFTSAEVEPAELGDVTLVPVAKLAPTITAAPATLDARTVDRVAAALTVAFPPASAADELPYVDDTRLPEALRADRAYLHLEPWSKAGRSRLYVRRAGTQIGYLDLVAKTFHPETDDDRDRQILSVLREWFANPKPVKDRIPLAAQVMLRAVGRNGQHVVALRDRGRGHDRLTVYLLSIEGRREIGTADLRAGIISPADPGLEPVVAKAVRAVKTAR